MRLPNQGEPVARQQSQRSQQGQQSQTGTKSGIEPSGCCAQVCLPIVGCQCVFEAPFC
jgi:hypothetical protein